MNAMSASVGVPLLSIVVPVYRVEGYLRQCLDSILGQGFADCEVVVVDDRSPDGCGAIIDEYAAKDSRVRALYLAQNVGLGRARNAGLAAATGEYVWFVDSDDWLAEGALAAVAERLGVARRAGRRLDMLVVDFTRYYEKDGSTKRSASTRALASVPGPEVFASADRPSIFSVFHVAWSRVVCRQFLLDHGLSFHAGLYEDVSWTFPALAAARRIAFLDRVCMFYRQREGAITKTGGAQHLEMIEQWARVLEPLAPDDPLRRLLFAQSMRHCLTVMGNETRLPDRMLRRRFFIRLADHYQRFAPPGDMPGGGRAFRFKTLLVARRLYPIYESVRAVRVMRDKVTPNRTRSGGVVIAAGQADEASGRRLGGTWRSPAVRRRSR
jgi:CDP-glycerol glycerophosphotransferase